MTIDIAELINAAAILVRQVSIWAREPAINEEELQRRHAAVTKFMEAVKDAGNALR